MSAWAEIGEYTVLGMDFCSERDYEKSLDYLYKALEIAWALHTPVNEAKVLNSIGIVMHVAGDVGNAQLMFDSAIETLIQAKGEDHPLVAHIRKNRCLAQGIDNQVQAVCRCE